MAVKMADKENYIFDNADDVMKSVKKAKANFSKRKVESVKDTDESMALQNAGIDATKAKKSTINAGNYKKAIFTDEQKIKFLDELSQHGVIKYACQKAGISRLTFYYNYQSDEEFRRLVEDAFALGAINIEDEAKIRAVEGVEEEVYFKGEMVGTVRKFSDFLLTFLLKGNFPYKYGGVQSEDIVSNALGQPKVKVAAAVKNTDAKEVNYAALSEEQLREMVASSMSNN